MALDGLDGEEQLAGDVCVLPPTEDQRGHLAFARRQRRADAPRTGRYEEALSELRRAVAIDRRTGHDYFIPALLAALLQPLIQLGRLPQAVALGEEAVEAAWTSGNTVLRLGAHGDLAMARHLRGDTDGAHREALEAVRLAAAGRLWRARAGWTLGIIEADRQPEAGSRHHRASRRIDTALTCD